MSIQTIGNLTILTASILMAFLIGGGLIEYKLVNEAVSKGYAEYYLDESNYKHWRWK